MSLRRKLSNQSALIFGGILGFVLLGTYFLFKQLSTDLYYKKLLDRAYTAAYFYLEKDELNNSRYQRIEEKYRRIADESIQLYNARTYQLVVNDSLPYQVPRHFLEEINRDRHLEFTYQDRLLVGMFYADNEGDFLIVSSGKNTVGQSQLTLLEGSLFVFFVVGLAINYLLTGWLARHTFTPFSRVISQVHSITADSLHTRLEVPSGKPDELSEVISTFNVFLARLEESIQIQRSFLKNASHELKTPLAVIIGDVEVALKKPRSNEEYVQLLQALEKDALHLTSIVEGLLLLSGLSLPIDQKMEPVLLDEILWTVLEKTQIRQPERTVTIDFEDMEGYQSLLTVIGNKDLLFTALSNLLDNALKFSTPKPVAILVKAIAGQLTIVLKDQGPGIPAAEEKLIFDLFYRSNQSRHIAGQGIGLYLTKQILDLHRIVLQIDSSKEGTTVQLTFPPQPAV